MFTKENRYLFLIVITFIAACIETDIYLPAFTDMMAYFSISEEKIQSLLTWNFVGICLSGPFYGPLSDSYGRKKPLLFALGLFLLGSIITVLSDNFDLMIFGRILQGLGSGGCFTLGTAIIFDVFQEKKAAAAINKLNSIIPFIMAGAPVLGGFLNETFGFRSNFLVIAIFVSASFIISLFFFEESLPVSKRAPFNIKKSLNDFKKVFLSVPFWQVTVIVSLLFSGYLAFLSGVSVFFVIELGVSKQALPYYQAAILGAWLLANITSHKVIARFGMQGTKLIGTGLFLLGGIGFFAAALLAPQDPNLLTAGMLLYSFGINWTMCLYFPESMEIFPEIKGVTASILTSSRLLITAVVVGISSALYDATIFPIMGVVVSAILISFALIILYERKKYHQERGEMAPSSSRM